MHLTHCVCFDGIEQLIAYAYLSALQEAQDVRQEFDQYKDEMADVSESMEMAALDKEMAEEKVRNYDKLQSLIFLFHIFVSCISIR